MDMDVIATASKGGADRKWAGYEAREKRRVYSVAKIKGRTSSPFPLFLFSSVLLFFLLQKHSLTSFTAGSGSTF